MTNEDLGRRAAEDFRAEFGLGDEPITSLARLIEQALGIGVAYVGTAAPGHGMTMRLDGRSMMAVGCTNHPMRLRSTLAHELGHLRLSSVDQYLDRTHWDARTPEEIQADSFARHLLVPLAAVRAVVNDAEPTLALLSRLVQTYLASPSVVAIQLREAGAINQNLCREWSELTSGRLASQFGWRTEYQGLVEQSRTPRAPQGLLARAIEGYRWNLINPAIIARLAGYPSAQALADQLAADGIVPMDDDHAATRRPIDTGDGLSPEELKLLEDGTH